MIETTPRQITLIRCGRLVGTLADWLRVHRTGDPPGSIEDFTIVFNDNGRLFGSVDPVDDNSVMVAARWSVRLFFFPPPAWRLWAEHWRHWVGENPWICCWEGEQTSHEAASAQAAQVLTALISDHAGWCRQQAIDLDLITLCWRLETDLRRIHGSPQ